MAVVAFHHGLRASEVCALRVKDVQDGYITVARLKGSRKTTQKLVKAYDVLLDEAPALEAHVKRVQADTNRADTNQDALLFPVSRHTFYRAVRAAGKRAGLPAHKCHPHIFKHTLATLAIRANVTIEKVQVQLGHASLSSTGAYLHCDSDEASEAIAKAVA